jgi:hypothetical protein
MDWMSKKKNPISMKTLQDSAVMPYFPTRISGDTNKTLAGKDSDSSASQCRMYSETRKLLQNRNLLAVTLIKPMVVVSTMSAVHKVNVACQRLFK